MRSFLMFVVFVMALVVPPSIAVRAQTARAPTFTATSLEGPMRSLERVQAEGQWKNTWRAPSAQSHWQARRLGKREMYGIACPTIRTCYILGIDGNASGWHNVVYRTADAGKTWEVHAMQSTPVPLGQMVCPAVRVCYAVGTTPREDGQPTRVSSVIVRTTDGAQTWHMVFSSSMANGKVTSCEAGSKGCVVVERVVCPASAICYALAYPALRAYTVPPTWSALLTTVDTGRTWRQRRINVSSDTAALACPSATVCYLVGGVNAVSSDGGRTWSKQPGGPRGFISSIDCPDIRVCYTAGFLSLDGGMATLGLTAVTDDGGMTWHEHRYQGAYMNALSCPAVSVCYAFGNKIARGIFVATRNGGMSWERETVPYVMRFASPRAVACPGTDTCYGVGNGIIFTRQ